MCAWKNEETNIGMKEGNNEWIITNASLCPDLTSLTRSFVSVTWCLRLPPSTCCSTCHRLFPLQRGRRWFFLSSSCSSLFKHLFPMWTIFSLYWDCYNIVSIGFVLVWGLTGRRSLDCWTAREVPFLVGRGGRECGPFLKFSLWYLLIFILSPLLREAAWLPQTTIALGLLIVSLIYMGVFHQSTCLSRLNTSVSLD